MTSESVHEVEIAYSQNSLLNKIQDYGLSKSTLCSKVRVNQIKLSELEVPEYYESESFESRLFHEIKGWHQSQNFEIFTSQINQLVYLWLNAIQDGTSTQITFSAPFVHHFNHTNDSQGRIADRNTEKTCGFEIQSLVDRLIEVRVGIRI